MTDNVYHKEQYIGFTVNSSVYLQKCGECRRENYVLSVPTGVCCWCGWDANKKDDENARQS